MSAGQDIKARETLLSLTPVLHGMSTQVCVLDSALALVVANEAFGVFADSIVSHTRDTHRGAAWGLILVAAGDAAPAVRAGAEAVKRGELASFEHDYAARIAGKLHFFSLRITAVKLAEEELLMLEQLDVTARKLLERRLLRAERAEGAELLASGVAHDLNNLLLIINGYTDLVGRGTSESNAADREEIARAVKSASGLTQQLLTMRPSALRSSTVAVNDVLKDLKRFFTKLAGDDNTFELQLGEQIGRVQCEAPQLQQLVANLVTNARDAMQGQGGGRVTLSTHNVVVDAGTNPPIVPPGHWVVVRVQDTGRGMGDTTLKQAFDAFFTTKTDDDSAGLGLWIVDEIVRRARGHVRITSSEGQGTTVDVYLPGLEASHGLFFAPSISPSARRATLLVVEDNTAVRELLQRMLRGAGYHVLVAAGPGEARAISDSSTQPIHLLLTDVVMSDMSGPLLARELQRSRPDLAVVLMSGYSAATTAQREEWLPTAVFLEKPFTAAHVLRTVQEALDAANKASQK